MLGPIGPPSFALLANYVAKCQMSSGLYGPISRISLVHVDMVPKILMVETLSNIGMVESLT